MALSRENTELQKTNKRRCNKCKIIKDINTFYPNKNSKNGYYSICKKCRSEYLKELRKDNWTYKENCNRWHRNNKNYLNKKRSERRMENPEKYRKKDREYYEKNKNKIMENRKKSQADWSIEKKKEYKLKSILRCRIKDAIRNGYKTTSMETLLECNMPFLISYLEERFQDGMSWDNYGRNGWHIDHIKPCALFDLTKLEEQKKCFHYSNLQPMWGNENCSKGKKYNEKPEEW